MTFELVGGPHDGFTFEADPDITSRRLYEPESKMDLLAPFTVFAQAHVHRYVRNDESNKLYYVGISSG
jgi:hypothetical protein